MGILKATSTLLVIAIVLAGVTVALLQLHRSDQPAAQATVAKSPIAKDVVQATSPPPAPAMPSVEEPSDKPEPVGPSGFVAAYLDLRQRFQKEGRDPVAAERETKILTHLSQQTGIALTTIEVECRSTICRVQLTGLDPGEQSRIFGSLQGFGRVMGTSLKESGVATTEVFVERGS